MKEPCRKAHDGPHSDLSSACSLLLSLAPQCQPQGTHSTSGPGAQEGKHWGVVTVGKWGCFPGVEQPLTWGCLGFAYRSCEELEASEGLGAD